MHRQVERDQVGVVQRIRLERLTREIDQSDLDTGRAEPGRRRGQTERLPSHFVGRDQDGGPSRAVRGWALVTHDRVVAIQLTVRNSAVVGGGVARLTMTSVEIESARAGYAVCQPNG